MATMTMALLSGSVDRLVSAGVILSGAAADDMEVDVYVLLMSARSFIKKNAENLTELSEVNHEKEVYDKAIEELNVPSWIEFFEQAREFTNVKIHVCSLAGKLWGGYKLDDFILVDDICGIGAYIDSIQETDTHVVI